MLGIEPPQPVPNFQALISGIITPKINAVSQTFAGLSSGVLGSSAGLSGSSSGSSSSSANGNDSDSSNGGGNGGGLSNVLSSVLRLSGPILSASLGNSGGGLAAGNDNTTPDPDDDF